MDGTNEWPTPTDETICNVPLFTVAFLFYTLDPIIVLSLYKNSSVNYSGTCPMAAFDGLFQDYWYMKNSWASFSNMDQTESYWSNVCEPTIYF